MNKQKVLLLSPDVKSVYGTPKYPSLGLAYLVAALLNDNHEVKALDLRFDKSVDLIKIVEEFNPQFIGFQSTILNVSIIKELHHKLKERFPDKIYLVGGPHPSFVPQDFDEFDHIIQGEGEEAIVKLIKGEIKEKYIKLDFIKDLNSISPPDWSHFGIKWDTLPILTTRGCPFNCIYCNVRSLFGTKHRKRSVNNIIKEIEKDILKYKARYIEIIDDNFSLDKQFVKTFCLELLSREIDIKWDCPQGIRIDTLDKECFDLMRRTGCRMIGIGIESGVQRIVDNIKKNLNLKKAKEKIKEAHEAGLTVKAFFLVGSPGETYNDVMQSIKFFKENKIDIPRFSMLAPYPNTEIYSWMYSNANVLVKNIDDYTHGVCDDVVCIPFDTPYFTKEERFKAYKLANREADIWTIRMRFGVIVGLIVRLPGILMVAKKIYFESTWMKRVMWK